MIRPAKKGSAAQQSLLKSQITDILARHPANRGSLIPVLQDVQEKLGYLSVEAVEELARLMEISANEIYGVATFYTQFRFSPPGEHTIQSCQGTACHVRGGHQLLKELEQRLRITAGETTTDGKFDLERVACLGCCALAPVVAVDGKVHARMTAKKIPPVISQYADEGNSDR
jgi:NADH-quinone oxidoreductase subunit E